MSKKERIKALEHIAKVGAKNDAYHERRLQDLEHCWTEHDDRLDAIEDRLDALEGREFLGEFVATPKTEGELLCSDREKVRVYAVEREENAKPAICEEDIKRRESEAYKRGKAEGIESGKSKILDMADKNKDKSAGHLLVLMLEAPDGWRKIVCMDAETMDGVVAAAREEVKAEGIAEGRELEKADVLEFVCVPNGNFGFYAIDGHSFIHAVERNAHRKGES